MSNAIRELIKLCEPVEILICAGRTALLEGTGEVTTLYVEDLITAFKKCQSGTLSFSQLAKWAEFLENNDLVDYASEKSDLISSILFQLSSSEINVPITSELLQKLSRDVDS